MTKATIIIEAYKGEPIINLMCAYPFKWHHMGRHLLIFIDPEQDMPVSWRTEMANLIEDVLLLGKWGEIKPEDTD